VTLKNWTQSSRPFAAKKISLKKFEQKAALANESRACLLICTFRYWRSPIDSVAAVPLVLSSDGKTIQEKDGEELKDPVDLPNPETVKYYFALQQLENSIRTGFQLATKSGPLCDEPMCGVAFIVSNVSIHKPIYDDAPGTSSAGPSLDSGDIDKAGVFDDGTITFKSRRGGGLWVGNVLE